MRLRYTVGIGLTLIFSLSALIYLISKAVNLLPDDFNTQILLWVAAVSATAAFLSQLRNVVELVEKATGKSRPAENTAKSLQDTAVEAKGQFKKRIGELISSHDKSIQKVKQAVGFEVPLLALAAMLFLLDQKTHTSRGNIFLLVVFVLGMMFLATKTIIAPMSSVTAFVIFMGFLAAYVLLIHPPDFPDAVLPVPFSDDLTLNNPKVAAYVLILAFLSIIWITSGIVASYVHRKQREVRAELDRLYDTSSISRSLDLGDEERYSRVVSEWQAFLNELAKSNGEAADLLESCLPEKFERWNLHIRSDKQSVVNHLTEERPIRGKSSTLPPFLRVAEPVFRDHYRMPHATLTCEILNKSDFETLKRRVESVGIQKSGRGQA